MSEILRNGCFTRCHHIPTMFIKPDLKCFVSPLQVVINNYMKTNSFCNAWETTKIKRVEYRPDSVLTRRVSKGVERLEDSPPLPSLNELNLL